LPKYKQKPVFPLFYLLIILDKPSFDFVTLCFASSATLQFPISVTLCFASSITLQFSTSVTLREVAGYYCYFFWIRRLRAG
jgi:hypothetical protein